MPTDAELLHRYASDRDEAAFAELVRRHIDLVYSAAMRRIGGDPHAAKEITQDVFLALGRNAAQLADHPVLAAWLHTCTRNAAIAFLRRERRRIRRHQEANAMQASYSPDHLAQAWTAVRPELDAALDELPEADRQALILRFFENQSYPALGARLGLHEEAARKRVDRSLEKLRARLQRRGIASTAALLGGALSAHGVAGAPAGLAAAVSATVATSSVAAPSLGILYFMSTTKLVVTLGALAAIVGISVLALNHNAVPSPVPVSKAAAAPSTQSSAPRPPAAPAPTAPVVVAPPAAVLATDTSPPTLTEEGAKVAALRDILVRLPEQGIPELKLATEADWYAAVEGNALESDEDVRRALGKIRGAAERRFAPLVQPALRAYLQANGDQFPSDPVELEPLVDRKVDLAMLQRYRVAPASEASSRVRLGTNFILTQKSLIDEKYDGHLVIGPSGFGVWTDSSGSMNSGAGGGPISGAGGGGGGMGRGP